jgi:multiple sugar transport system substrate-binding protein
MTTPAAETSITENIGYPPLRPSIADASQYLESWAAANPFVTPNLYQLEHLKAWQSYPGTNYLAISAILINAADSIIFQNADPKSTMAAAQSQATPLF